MSKELEEKTFLDAIDAVVEQIKKLNDYENNPDYQYKKTPAMTAKSQILIELSRVIITHESRPNIINPMAAELVNAVKTQNAQDLAAINEAATI